MKGRTLSFSLCIFLLLAAGCATLRIQKQIKALGHGYRSVRRNAASALVKIGAPAVEPLSKALGDKRRYVRENAAWALGEIDDASAVPALTQALKDENRLVRRAAEKAIAKIKAK